MKRLFWLGVGVAAGVSLSRKASSTARKATPVGIAENLGGAFRELAEALGAFGADVRAGMSEREAELNETVERASGIAPGARPALADRLPSPTPRTAADAGQARARRAGG